MGAPSLTPAEMGNHLLVWAIRQAEHNKNDEINRTRRERQFAGQLVDADRAGFIAAISLRAGNKCEGPATVC